MSERPEPHDPRRLLYWINPAGDRKVHSLVDKVKKRKNLEVARPMSASSSTSLTAGLFGGSGRIVSVLAQRRLATAAGAPAARRIRTRTPALFGSFLEPSMRHLCESGLRENRTGRLSGGRRPALRGASSDPTLGTITQQQTYFTVSCIVLILNSVFAVHPHSCKI